MSKPKKVAFAPGEERVEDYVNHVEAQNAKLQKRLQDSKMKVNPKAGK